MSRGGRFERTPSWTPNQIVAANLARLRQRRGWTQAETAVRLSRYTPKAWSEATVAHAERSVTGSRVREFTADDLVALARAFDVPVLALLTPSPDVLVNLPDHRAPAPARIVLETVMGRLHNMAEWEVLLDEWGLPPDDEVPFPLDEAARRRVRATARELAKVQAHHIIRHYFTDTDLVELRRTLESLASLVTSVHNHELLAELTDEELLGGLEHVREVKAKDRRLVARLEGRDEAEG